MLNVLNWVLKNRNSVLNRVGKSAIFVSNRVRVSGAVPHLPTEGYIEYPPREYILVYVHAPQSKTFSYLFKIADLSEDCNNYFVHEGVHEIPQPLTLSIDVHLKQSC